jgi:hypothetical protein
LWQAAQVPPKIWEGLLPASRFCARTGAAAKPPIRSITVAKLSARLNILCSPDAEFASVDARLHTSRGGHLLADYPANGSAQMTQLREPNNSGYPLCNDTSAEVPALL